MVRAWECDRVSRACGLLKPGSVKRKSGLGLPAGNVSVFSEK